MEESSLQNTIGTPMEELSANDYFRACAIGYTANHYSDGDQTPREQYYLHADGRDGGLGEVVRGGNSTHISLYPQYKEDGFTFLLDGASVSRTIETVRFYLALRKADLPVYIRDGSILADRLTDNEKIGIVPQGITHVYCVSLFPKERIISFTNLDCEKLDEVVRHCIWQPIPQAKLRL